MNPITYKQQTQKALIAPHISFHFSLFMRTMHHNNKFPNSLIDLTIHLNAEKATFNIFKKEHNNLYDRAYHVIHGQ